MKKLLFVLAVTVILLLPSAEAGQHTWNNTSTDFNSTGSWTGGVPGLGDVAVFNTGPASQPNLSASLSIAGLYFTTANGVGYDLTATNAASLTLTGADTSGSGGTSNSTAAAIRSDNTFFTNTIDGPVVLAPASGNQSTFIQADGGALVMNGVISSAAGVNLSLRGGLIILNNSNSHAMTSIDGSVSPTNRITVQLGNDGALGNGTFTINSTANLSAGGGARSISNAVVLDGDTALIGANAFTFTGSVASAGSNARTLSVSNTGGATFNGTVSLQETGAPAGRQLTIDGTAPVVINGVVQDGNVNPATLRYAGINRITLNNTNTYSGGTVLMGGLMLVTKDGGLGSGNVRLSGNVSLTLQDGATNNYIADLAALSLDSTATVNLNFSGADTINNLVIDGTNEATGTWGSPGSGAMHTSPVFNGTGILDVLNVPEPGTYVLLAFGAMLLVKHFHRDKS